jgi:hypothetical protein
VFITGAAGFIESWLCDMMVGFRAEVTLLMICQPEGQNARRMANYAEISNASSSRKSTFYMITGILIQCRFSFRGSV